jgi:hypothetical protein
MVAGCIDEYWEIKRPSGMKPDEIPAWLSECGGYTKVYRDRLQRLREPKCNIGERYAEFLELKPVEEREIPDWLGGFSGEIIIAAHVDDVARKLQYRSVWRPEHPSFWHSRLEQFFAARRESSETVEAVCMPRDEPTTDPGPVGGTTDSETPDIVVTRLANIEYNPAQIEPDVKRAAVDGKGNKIKEPFDEKKTKFAGGTLHLRDPVARLRIVDRLAASVSRAAVLPDTQRPATPNASSKPQNGGHGSQAGFGRHFERNR